MSEPSPRLPRRRVSARHALIAGFIAICTGLACGPSKTQEGEPVAGPTPLPLPPISDDTWTPDAGVPDVTLPFRRPVAVLPPAEEVLAEVPGTEPPATEPPPTQPADPLAPLPTCSGGVMASFTLSALSPPSQGSNAYRVPSDSRRDALATSIRSLLAEDATTALTAATSAEYLLCRGSGNESQLALWRPAPGEGQALVVLRMGLARGAIFEAPHIVFDTDTLAESVVLFQNLGARALIASGTHRCANSEASPCSGSTAVCGSSAPYRISDMAHTDRSAFHAAHIALSEHFSEDWVLQIHGMSRSGISVSNGTSGSTDASAPSARLATALSQAFSGVTTCNAYTGGVPYESHLCGTTNTQGRHVNGSSNACTSAAGTNSRRFIHLEQSRTVRDQAALVADVMDSVLP